MPAPVTLKLYELSSGSGRWSIRSSPHEGTGDCVWSARNTWSRSTNATRGSDASRPATESGMAAANPSSADENTKSGATLNDAAMDIDISRASPAPARRTTM